MIILIIFFLFLALPASADAGIPMLVLLEPLFVLSLIFVIMIEMIVLIKRLNLPFKTAFQVVSVSNLISTLMGIPLTWIALTVLELLFTPLFKNYSYSMLLFPAWIIENGPLLWSVVYLTVVFYFVSAWVETIFNKKMLKSHNPQNIKKATWEANLYSYLFIGILEALWFLNVGNVATKTWQLLQNLFKTLIKSYINNLS